MDERRAPWRFYGREREIGRLRTVTGAGGFRMLAVTGGRGAGKTRLIEEALKGQPPAVQITLPDASGSGIAERRGLAEECCVRLERGMRRAGFRAAPRGGCESHERPGRFLKKTLGVLMRAGAVVTIDEFQNAVQLGLTAAVQAGLKPVRRGRSVTGKLIVAGARRQEMLQLLDGAGEALVLRPLAGAEMLEMAAEQGWLAKPRRFLAAYAVFGGVPSRWERLAAEQRDGLLPEPPDGSDGTWRRMFLAREVGRLRGAAAEKFVHPALAALSAEELLIAGMAAAEPRGRRWSGIRRRFRRRVQPADSPADSAAAKAAAKAAVQARAAAALRALQERLLLVERTGGNFGGGRFKIRMADHAALFELTAAAVWPEGDPDFGDSRYGRPLAEAEAAALERLAEEWIRTRPGLTWSVRGLEAGRKDTAAEIDVAAGVGEPDSCEPLPRLLRVMASCRRRPKAHRANRTRAKFQRALGMHGLGGRPRRPWPEDIERLLISPERPAAPASPDGFVRRGLPDMARELGLEIRPWPAPPSRRK